MPEQGSLKSEPQFEKFIPEDRLEEWLEGHLSVSFVLFLAREKLTQKYSGIGMERLEIEFTEGEGQGDFEVSNLDNWIASCATIVEETQPLLPH